MRTRTVRAGWCKLMAPRAATFTAQQFPGMRHKRLVAANGGWSRGFSSSADGPEHEVEHKERADRVWAKDDVAELVPLHQVDKSYQVMKGLSAEEELSYHKAQTRLKFSISAESAVNVEKLKADLGVLSNAEERLFATIFQAPFLVRHCSTNPAAVIASGKIHSNVGLHERNIPFIGGTGQHDHNKAFVFFNLLTRAEKEQDVFYFHARDLVGKAYATLEDLHVYKHQYQGCPPVETRIGDTLLKKSIKGNQVTYGFSVGGRHTGGITLSVKQHHYAGADIFNALGMLFVQMVRYMDSGTQKEIYLSKGSALEAFREQLPGIEFKFPDMVKLDNAMLSDREGRLRPCNEAERQKALVYMKTRGYRELMKAIEGDHYSGRNY